MNQRICAFLLVALPSAAWAGGLATDCVRLGTFERYGNRGQTITNSCDSDIEVVWCVNMGSTRVDCHTGGRYYQQRHVLHAGETHDNLYTLPAGQDIRYAACYGGYNSVTFPDKTSSSVGCR